MSDFNIFENPLANFDPDPAPLEGDSGIDSTDQATVNTREEEIEDVEEDVTPPSLKQLLDETPLTTNPSKTKSPKLLNQTGLVNADKADMTPPSKPHDTLADTLACTPATTERRAAAASLIALANVMHSDSEDDDYCPTAAVAEGSAEEEEEEPIARQYKLRDVTKGAVVEEVKEVQHTDVDKKKADDLWSAFKADVKLPTRRRAPKAASADKAKEVTYDFAGESVNAKGESVKGGEEGRKNKRKSFLNTIGLSDMDRKRRRESAPVLPRSESVETDSSESSTAGPAAKKPVSKLSSLVSRLSKKPKMTILNKTSLDWDKYKSDKGIEDEVKNEAKGGYLEKQDFLSRTDERQYELEKEIRLQIQRRRQMMNSKQH